MMHRAPRREGPAADNQTSGRVLTKLGFRNARRRSCARWSTAARARSTTARFESDEQNRAGAKPVSVSFLRLIRCCGTGRSRKAGVWSPMPGPSRAFGAIVPAPTFVALGASRASRDARRVLARGRCRLGACSLPCSCAAGARDRASSLRGGCGCAWRGCRSRCGLLRWRCPALPRLRRQRPPGSAVGVDRRHRRDMLVLRRPSRSTAAAALSATLASAAPLVAVALAIAAMRAMIGRDLDVGHLFALHRLAGQLLDRRDVLEVAAARRA